MIRSNQMENTIINIIMLLMFITFIVHVFKWFKHKLEISHVRQKMIDQNRQQKSSKIQNESKQYHGNMSLFRFINTPVIKLLQQRAEEQQQSNQITTKYYSKHIIIAVSCLLTTIICLLFLSFCLDNQFLSSTLINPLKQAFIQSFNLSQQVTINSSQDRVLYHNEQQQIIYKFHLISSFAFMVVIIRAVLKIEQQDHRGKQRQTSFNYYDSAIDFILRLIMVLADPWFISVIILQFMIKCFFNNSNKNIKPKTTINTFQIITYLTLILLFSVQLYYSTNNPQHPLTQTSTTTIFPKQFTPQSNLIWILYAHMFNRYLPMYQLIMFLLPLSFAVPLSLLNINYQTKIICQYFVIIFSSYYCTDLHIYLFWVLVFFNVNNFLSYKDAFMKTINKTLGLIAFFGSTLFFLFYKRMVSLFLTTWMLNIGYPFLFGCIAWALIVVWMAELIRIQLQQFGGVPYNPKQTGKVMLIIHQFKQQIKNKLWTKNH